MYICNEKREKRELLDILKKMKYNLTLEEFGFCCHRFAMSNLQCISWYKSINWDRLGCLCD